MENEITAHQAGKITELAVSEGASVNPGDLLAKIEYETATSRRASPLPRGGS